MIGVQVSGVVMSLNGLKKSNKLRLFFHWLGFLLFPYYSVAQICPDISSAPFCPDSCSIQLI